MRDYNADKETRMHFEDDHGSSSILQHETCDVLLVCVLLRVESRQIAISLPPRKLGASGYLHDMLLISIIPSLRHRNMEIVDIVNQIRGPYECITKEVDPGVGSIDAEIAQRCAVTGCHGANVRRGSERIQQLGVGDPNLWTRRTTETEFERGVGFPLRTGDVRKSKMFGRVHGGRDLLE